MKIERISMIGLGAIGLAYATKLHDAMGDRFRVIVDEGRKKRYEEEGFYVNGRRYDFHYVADGEADDPDLILIAVKYHHLDRVIEQIRKHVGEKTLIMPLLNGITSEERVGAVYGMDRVLYATCIQIDALRDRNQVTFTQNGSIHFGEKSGEISARVLAVARVLEEAGIQVVTPEDMWRTLWWKFMVNVGINQPSAVLKAPYRVFKTSEHAMALMRDTMEEVIRVAKAEGVSLGAEDVDRFVEIMMTLGDDKMTSMCQDMIAGRKTEVEMLSGELMRLAERHGIDVPVNRTLFEMIKTMEMMNGVGV